MKRLLTILLSVVALWACDPTFENPPKENEPETPERPENALSTLTEDVTLVFGADTSLCYADCFGDYYRTGLYMWQFYFMEFGSKEMLCVEVMVNPDELTMPTGTFLATSDIYKANGMIQGIIDEEGYNAYSWYTLTNSKGQILARAPIAKGSVMVTANDDGTHSATFSLEDDAFNKITGEYSGIIIVEDFR